MKIVSLVMNAATRDARVIKEARSLRRAGHDVIVIGIKDNNNPSASALLEDGLEVRRVDWRADAYRRASTVYLRMAAAAAAVGFAVIALIAWLSRGFLAALAGRIASLWNAPWRLSSGAADAEGFWAGAGNLALLLAKIIVFAGAAGLLLFLLAIIARRAFAIVNNAFLSKVRKIMATANRFAEDAPGAEKSSNLLFDLVAGGPVQTVGAAASGFNDSTINRLIKQSRLDAMVALASEFQPDVIHSHEVMTLPAAVRIKKKTGAKIIYDAHELYEELAQASGDLLRSHRQTHEECMKHVDGFITVNDSIAAEYKKRYPAVGRPVVIKNATEHVQLPEYDGRLHEAAGLPREQKILLYQGGFAAKRGLEELVKAGRILPADWSLVMMGWGRHEQVLRDIVEEGLNEWRAETMEARRRHIMTNLPEEKRAALEDHIENTLLENAPVVKKPRKRKRLRSHVENMISGTTDEKTSDPFAYEDDPAVAAQSQALGTLVNLRLNKQNLDDPLLADRYLNIRFVPPAPRDELEQWTQGASIGVIPYENDGLNHWFCSPNKLWEYPNAGVPILACSFPELHKIVIGEGVGWVLPPDPKAADIARSVARLNDVEIAQKRQACKTFIEKDNWSVYEEKLVNAFAALADGASRNAPAKRLRKRAAAE